LGLRYRVNQRIQDVDLIVRPDLVFASKKVCVFVDGCFWHRCPIHGSQPKSNAAYWEEKLAKNVARDRRADKALRAAGWKVVRCWEHEDVVLAAERIASAVAGHRASR
jgi:DNA mismatch endonuclease (patch repair protein)